MDEETTRKVMQKYFESKGLKPIPTRGAGPDFHLNGKAIEIKGSKVKGNKNDFHRMLRQLVDYARKYIAVELALPFDGLNIEQAYQLNDLFHMIETAKDIRLKIYLVVKNPTKENSFFVKEYKQPIIITANMDFRQPYPRPTDFTLKEAVEKLINYSPTEELKNSILGLDLDRTEVEI